MLKLLTALIAISTAIHSSSSSNRYRYTTSSYTGYTAAYTPTTTTGYTTPSTYSYATGYTTPTYGYVAPTTYSYGSNFAPVYTGSAVYYAAPTYTTNNNYYGVMGNTYSNYVPDCAEGQWVGYTGYNNHGDPYCYTPADAEK